VNIREKLNRIRAPKPLSHPVLARILFAFFALFSGGALGWAAKELDRAWMWKKTFGYIGSYLGQLGSQLGIWIFLATLLAIYSPTHISAAYHVLLFFLAMLATYYLHTALIEGFFFKRVVFAWTIIALFSPLCGWCVWFSRGKGYIAAVCAAVPISLLFTEGYPFFYTGNILLGFDIAAAILLYFLTAQGKKQKIMALPFIAVFFILFESTNFLSLVFGGL